MRKTLVFRLVALKVLVISAVSLGCGGEVANANFDPHDPFNPTYAREVLNRVEWYAQLLKSWQRGSDAYTERSQPMTVLRLAFTATGLVGLADQQVTIADQLSEEKPFRVTDALQSILEEVALIRQNQALRMGDTLDAFSGGDSVDRLIGDVAFLHRFVQGLLAIRLFQQQILELEEAGAAALPGSTKKVSLLNSAEIDSVRAEIVRRSSANSPTIVLLDRSAGRAEPSQLMNRLTRASYHQNGAPTGFQRILQRYQVLTKTLGVADHAALESLLNRIDAVREHATPVVPDLPFPW